MSGYCMDCKKQQEIINLKKKKLINGQKVYQGNCIICNSNITKVIKG